MTRTRTLGIVVGLVLAAQAVQGQDRSRYRDFQLGSDLSSVAALAKVTASQARTIHQRPALIQELEWRRPYTTGGSTSQTDPVQRIAFGFYDGQLFRLVIDYDRQRTTGLTDGDMIDAISETYGSTLLPALKKVPAVLSKIETESGLPVARWGDADYAVVLYRSSYASEFRVIVTLPRLETLAASAAAQAVKLDEREAPQREIARQKKLADDTRASDEKARVANKATFRP